MKNAIKKGFPWIASYAIPDLGNGESVSYEHFYCLTGFKLQNLIFQRRSLQKTERGKNKNFNWLTEMPLPENLTQRTTGRRKYSFHPFLRYLSSSMQIETVYYWTVYIV